MEVNARLRAGNGAPSWRNALAEFTGERVIPGRGGCRPAERAPGALRLRGAPGARQARAGCRLRRGLRVGRAGAARRDRWWAWIVAAEAVDFARAHYRLPNLRFEQASCTALPHPDGAFDLVVAFEVIEHLEDWREFLREARRVLAPSGQFIVSTPNKLYYTESRGADGRQPVPRARIRFRGVPRASWQRVFPHVSLFLENHVEGVTFQPHERRAHGGGAGGRGRAGAATNRTSSWRSARTGRRSATPPSSTCRARPTCCASGSGTSPCWKASWRPRTAGWTGAADLASRRQHRSCWSSSASRPPSWSAATSGRKTLNRGTGQAARAHRGIAGGTGARAGERRRVAEGYEAKIGELEEELRAKTEWAQRHRSAADRGAAKRRARERTRGARRRKRCTRTEKELEERTAWALRLAGGWRRAAKSSWRCTGPRAGSGWAARSGWVRLAGD